MRRIIVIRSFARKTTIRSLLTALAVVAAAGGITTVGQTPALAAGCYRSSCNGQDPQSMGCGTDAYPLASFTYTGSNEFLRGSFLELRYSPACDAAWVRTTNGDCFGMWRPCGSVLEVSGGTAQQSEPHPGQMWTNMWSFRYYVRGCFTLPDWYSGTYVTDGCTSWK
ncbi:DUF2690 domain-containing protein [Actinophytocola sp.]|uniref:DUF2690 domain-containing protein n=1 Tax=Actinophytocola sp. TaxID=1872138 RepID=UPI0039C899EF